MQTLAPIKHETRTESSWGAGLDNCEDFDSFMESLVPLDTSLVTESLGRGFGLVTGSETTCWGSAPAFGKQEQQPAVMSGGPLPAGLLPFDPRDGEGLGRCPTPAQGGQQALGAGQQGFPFGAGMALPGALPFGQPPTMPVPPQPPPGQAGFGLLNPQFQPPPGGFPGALPAPSGLAAAGGPQGPGQPAPAQPGQAAAEQQQRAAAEQQYAQQLAAQAQMQQAAAYAFQAQQQQQQAQQQMAAAQQQQMMAAQQQQQQQGANPYALAAAAAAGYGGMGPAGMPPFPGWGPYQFPYWNPQQWGQQGMPYPGMPYGQPQMPGGMQLPNPAVLGGAGGGQQLPLPLQLPPQDGEQLEGAHLANGGGYLHLAGAGLEPGLDSDPQALKRPRLIWTAMLHRRFVEALDKCGGVDKALPKAIMKEMDVKGLTRENVASHLQKHRMRLRKGEENGGRQAGDEGEAQEANGSSGHAPEQHQEGQAQGKAPRKGRRKAAAGAAAGAAATAAAAAVQQQQQQPAGAASTQSDGRTVEGVSPGGDQDTGEGEVTKGAAGTTGDASGIGEPPAKRQQLGRG